MLSDEVTVFGVAVAVDAIHAQLGVAQRKFRKQIRKERELEGRKERAREAATLREEREWCEAREEEARLMKGGEAGGGGREEERGEGGASEASSDEQEMDAFFARSRVQGLADEEEEDDEEVVVVDSSDAESEASIREAIMEVKSPDGVWGFRYVFGTHQPTSPAFHA